jgi:hypothetical protein
MATLVVTAAPKFPENAIVGAYAQRLWAGDAPQPGDKPRAPRESWGGVDSYGFVQIEGLADDTTYYIGGHGVGGEWAWKTMRTPPQGSGGGGGGGGGAVASVNGHVGTVVLSSSDVGALPAASVGVATGAAGLDAGGHVPTAQLGPDVIKGDKFPSVGEASVAGFVTPDISKGHVFPMKTTGPLTINAPSNAPENAFTIIELWIKGNQPLKFWPGLKWIGPQPVPDLTSSTSMNPYAFVTLDGISWYGLAGAALPAGVVTVVGALTTGYTIIWNGTEFVMAPLPTSGVSLADLEAKAILGVGPMKGSNEPEPIGGSPWLPCATTSNTFLWRDAGTVVDEWAKPRTKVGFSVEANATCISDALYEVVPAGVNSTLTLPDFSAGTVDIGDEIIVVNASGGTIKVKGKTNLAEVAEHQTTNVTTPEMRTYTLRPNGVWTVTSGYRSTEAVEALTAPGAWTAFSSLGAKIEAVSGGYTAQSRLEQHGANVRLRGVLATKAGEALKTGERLCTLASGHRPAVAEVRVQGLAGATPATFGILENGQVLLRSAAEIAAATTIWLDSVTFSVT